LVVVVVVVWWWWWGATIMEQKCTQTCKLAGISRARHKNAILNRFKGMQQRTETGRGELGRVVAWHGRARLP